MLTQKQIDKLYLNATEVRLNSYSPYSNFKVGAALLMKDDKIIVGTNIENASFGLTSCAERNALFSALSLGYKKEDIIGLLIVADCNVPCSPCGACRQVISELIDEDVDVILTNLKKDFKMIKVKDLLPFSFTKEDLNNV